eukprot:s303_g7.t1
MQGEMSTNSGSATSVGGETAGDDELAVLEKEVEGEIHGLMSGGAGASPPNMTPPVHEHPSLMSPSGPAASPTPKPAAPAAAGGVTGNLAAGLGVADEGLLPSAIHDPVVEERVRGTISKMDEAQFTKSLHEAKSHPEFNSYVKGIRLEIGDETGTEWTFGEEEPEEDLVGFYVWVHSKSNLRKRLGLEGGGASHVGGTTPGDEQLQHPSMKENAGTHPASILKPPQPAQHKQGQPAVGRPLQSAATEASHDATPKQPQHPVANQPLVPSAEATPSWGPTDCVVPPPPPPNGWTSTAAPPAAATAVPPVTSTPAVIAAPPVTSTPAVTAVPPVTSTPAVTAAPPVTSTPAVTAAPPVTSTPAVTAAPAAVTAAPAVTSTPAVTAAPAVTSTPAVTAAPEVTSTPPVTAAPAVASTPAVTAAPTTAPVTAPAEPTPPPLAKAIPHLPPPAKATATPAPAHATTPVTPTAPAPTELSAVVNQALATPAATAPSATPKAPSPNEEDGKPTSVTHRAEYMAYLRAARNPNKLPAALRAHFSSADTRLDLFRLWLDKGRDFNQVQVEVQRRNTQRQTSTSRNVALSRTQLLADPRYTEADVDALIQRRTMEGAWIADPNFPDRIDLRQYVVHTETSGEDSRVREDSQAINSTTSATPAEAMTMLDDGNDFAMNTAPTVRSLASELAGLPPAPAAEPKHAGPQAKPKAKPKAKPRGGKPKKGEEANTGEGDKDTPPDRLPTPLEKAKLLKTKVLKEAEEARTMCVSIEGLECSTDMVAALTQHSEAMLKVYRDLNQLTISGVDDEDSYAQLFHYASTYSAWYSKRKRVVNSMRAAATSQG